MRTSLTRLSAVLIAAAASSGCVSLPPPPDVPSTYAIPGSDATPLGSIVAAQGSAKNVTGTRLIYRGAAALEARLALIHEATRSLDLQYYDFQPDYAGRLLAGALVDAAERGVRVRLLLDDWYTTESNDMLMGLSKVPGIEVRLYNPFTAPLRDGLGRRLNLASHFGALNARMHNKLFIADGAVAVVGGRNVADGYFEQGSGDFFIDFDVVVAGALLPDLATLFDEYWNSNAVWPVAAVLTNDLSRQQSSSKFVRDLPRDGWPSALAPDRFGRGPLKAELGAGRLSLHWDGTAVAFADKPLRRSTSDLVLSNSSDEASSLREIVWRRMARTDTEYLIVTPYLVPGERGMMQVERNTARGVHISILTNSLASTDVPWVHAAYRRYRVPMLAEGVELNELSAAATPQWGEGTSDSRRRATLHAKCVVFDRRSVFLGSLNFDPRSMSINTEVGVLFDDEHLAREVLEVVSDLRASSSYGLTLDGLGGVQWLPSDGRSALDAEPEADFGRRFLDTILSPLFPESVL